MNSQVPVGKPPNAEQTIKNSIEAAPAVLTLDSSSKNLQLLAKTMLLCKLVLPRTLALLLMRTLKLQLPTLPMLSKPSRNSIGAAPAVLTLDSSSNKSPADNQENTPEQASSFQKSVTTSDVNSQVPVGKPPNAEQTIQNSIGAAPAVLTLDSSSNKSPVISQDNTPVQAKSSQNPGTTSDVNSQVPLGNPPNAEQTIKNSIGAAPAVLTLNSSSKKSPVISQDNAPVQVRSSQTPGTTSDENSQVPVGNPPNAEQTIKNPIGEAPSVLLLDSSSKNLQLLAETILLSKLKSDTTSDVNSQVPVDNPPNAEQTIRNSIEAPALKQKSLDISQDNTPVQVRSSQNPGTTSDVNSQVPVGNPPNAEQTIRNSIEAPTVLLLVSASNKSSVDSQDYTSKQASSSRKPGTTFPDDNSEVLVKTIEGAPTFVSFIKPSITESEPKVSKQSLTIESSSEKFQPSTLDIDQVESFKHPLSALTIEDASTKGYPTTNSQVFNIEPKQQSFLDSEVYTNLSKENPSKEELGKGSPALIDNPEKRDASLPEDSVVMPAVEVNPKLPINYLLLYKDSQSTPQAEVDITKKVELSSQHPDLSYNSIFTSKEVDSHEGPGETKKINSSSGPEQLYSTPVASINLSDVSFLSVKDSQQSYQEKKTVPLLSEKYELSNPSITRITPSFESNLPLDVYDAEKEKGKIA
ncbi:hypothetical protein DSO57_1001890 [Entomophthora muscae]|uniref:Uncharacterized protein n=1 Tax=Entomophthora muscae TaxID=34485 RepID=A0ACC2TJJ9_9FUNG|nr:hypothetical protein DSO57_1001890 [Entomophthora muscae]